MLPPNNLGPDLNGKSINETKYRGKSLRKYHPYLLLRNFSKYLKDHILKGDIELHFILTQYQLADIFTKPLDEPIFKRLIVELGSDKSKITRKQSKVSKHGHENQKSAKPKPQKTKALANFHLQGPILLSSKSPSPFPIPVVDSDAFFEESDTSLSHSNNSLPEFESFSDQTEETRSGSTTTHANYSLPEYESFHFDNSSFSRPHPEPPDVEICLHFEPDAPVIDNFNDLNDDQRGSEIDFSQNVEDDDSFTFIIRTFLPFLTYPEASPLSCSTRSEDTIFDPCIITFPFSYPQPVAFSMEVS
ncbi:hypothetical protein Tco_0722822, partial [Tanacetum coccineum]